MKKAMEYIIKGLLFIVAIPIMIVLFIYWMLEEIL
tara:strand:+ start:1141 stop:1245 length:105 start_codon:yes stop_codon:yes gene_type:complete